MKRLVIWFMLWRERRLRNRKVRLAAQAAWEDFARLMELDKD